MLNSFDKIRTLSSTLVDYALSKKGLSLPCLAISYGEWLVCSCLRFWCCHLLVFMPWLAPLPFLFNFCHRFVQVWCVASAHVRLCSCVHCTLCAPSCWLGRCCLTKELCLTTLPKRSPFQNQYLRFFKLQACADFDVSCKCCDVGCQ